MKKKGGISLCLSGNGNDVFEEYFGLIQQKEDIIISVGKMILEKIEESKGENFKWV